MLVSGALVELLFEQPLTATDNANMPANIRTNDRISFFLSHIANWSKSSAGHFLVSGLWGEASPNDSGSWRWLRPIRRNKPEN